MTSSTQDSTIRERADHRGPLPLVGMGSCVVLGTVATAAIAVSIAIGVLLLSGGPPLWGPVAFTVKAWMVGAAVAAIYLAIRPVRRSGDCAARVLGVCSLSILMLLTLCYLCDRRISPEPRPNEMWTVFVSYQGHAGIVPRLLEFSTLCSAVAASLLTGMGFLYFRARSAPPRRRLKRADQRALDG